MLSNHSSSAVSNTSSAMSTTTINASRSDMETAAFHTGRKLEPVVNVAASALRRLARGWARAAANITGRGDIDIVNAPPPRIASSSSAGQLSSSAEQPISSSISSSQMNHSSSTGRKENPGISGGDIASLVLYSVGLSAAAITAFLCAIGVCSRRGGHYSDVEAYGIGLREQPIEIPIPPRDDENMHLEGHQVRIAGGYVHRIAPPVPSPEAYRNRPQNIEMHR